MPTDKLASAGAAGLSDSGGAALGMSSHPLYGARWIGVSVWIVALLLISALAFMLAYPVMRSLPFFAEVPIENWTSLDWRPGDGFFGFGTAMAGSLLLVLAVLPLSLTLGWLIGVQLADSRRSWVNPLSIALLEVWVALPSVIIGVWAMMQLVPMVRDVAGSGYSLVTAAIGLTIFITPTCTLLFYRSYRLHLQHYQGLETSFEMSVLSRSELFIKSQPSAVVGTINYIFCRVFGETMIVLMLSGNSLQIPGNPFEGMRSLTATIALEMSYATGMHQTSLFALATIAMLLIFFVLLAQYKRLSNAHRD